MQTLLFLPLRGAVLHMREIVITRLYFFTHPRYFFISCAPVEIARLTDFRVLWLKRRVSATATSFLGANKKF